MASTARASERPTFASQCSLVVVDPTRSSTASSSNGTDALFRAVLLGERGRRLRARLAAQHRSCSPEEIEEAIQIACRRFVDRAEGISAPGQVYTWIRTTAHRELCREVGHKAYEVPVDPEGDAMRDLVAQQPGPEEEAITQEKEAELGTLVEDALSSLPDIQREILALYIDGCGRQRFAPGSICPITRSSANCASLWPERGRRSPSASAVAASAANSSSCASSAGSRPPPKPPRPACTSATASAASYSASG